MDTKRVLSAVMIAIAVALLWTPAVTFIFKQLGLTPPPSSQTAQNQATDNPSTPPTTSVAIAPTSGPSATTGGGMPSVSASSAPAYAVRENVEVAPTISLGSATPSDPNFAMQLNISPRGAGLQSVILNDFKRTATGSDRYMFQQPYPSFEDRSRPLATRTVWINGSSIDLSTANWKLVKNDGSSATYAVEIGGIDAPVARITKTFAVTPRSGDNNTPRGFEVGVKQQIENLSNQPLTVRFDLNGPTTPPEELDRGQDRQVISGYANDTLVQVDHQYLEGFTKDHPTRDMSKSEKDNFPLLWAGTCSVYFNALVRPDPMPEDAKPSISPAYMKSVLAEMLFEGVNRGHDRLVAVTFSSDERTIEPSKTLTVPMRVYFGPRQRSLLTNAYYSAFPLEYNQSLVLVSGMCGYCTFTWLVNALVGLLAFFHFIFRDWGLAIIALVGLVRIALHPITKRSQISMMKMGKLGPEIERLKKKHADNPDELNKAMMTFYKENGASPVLGCAPMFLQMPIWIALWQSLQTTFELRQAPFLHPFGIPLTWIHDLSQPDHLLQWKTFMLFGLIPVSGLNILPVLLGFVFWLQAKYQPKPVATTPEQEQQQKMMQWMMPFLFPLFLYGGPSGLNLYILTSTGIGIIESKIIRKHIKEKEEAEKAGRVIVDAKPTRNQKLARNDDKEPPKTGGILGKLAELQRKVEELREKKPRDSR